MIHVGTSSQRSVHLSNSNQHKPNKPISNSPLISHPLPLLPLIPILRIATLIPQHIPSIPPPHHNTKSITRNSHQPVRSPRKRQRNLCTVQHKQQLRQRRLHVLRVAVVEVRVDVAETVGVSSAKVSWTVYATLEVFVCLFSWHSDSGFRGWESTRQIDRSTHNFELASLSKPADMGETSVLISIVQGPSWVSSTLNVCRALAGMRTG